MMVDGGSSGRWLEQLLRAYILSHKQEAERSLEMVGGLQFTFSKVPFPHLSPNNSINKGHCIQTQEHLSIQTTTGIFYMTNCKILFFLCYHFKESVF